MQLTVGSHTISNYNAGGSTATLKIRANDTFLTSDGATVHRNYATPQTFYLTVNCTVSGTTVTVPSFTIDSTTDSSTVNATYTGVLYDSNGNKVQAHFSGWRFSHTFGASPTWTQLDTYNATNHSPLIQGFPTTEEVQTLINAAAIASVSLSNTYGNSLVTAVSSIGATPTALLIGADATLSSSVTIPSTLFLKFEGGAKIAKSATGAITFQGIGLTNPESQSPIFSGFASGDITWTGSTWPAVLSSNLWDDTSASVKVNKADAAVSGKQATIIGFPGVRDSRITLTSGHTLYLTRGTHTSTYTSTDFVLSDNTRLVGDGSGQTFVVENAATPSMVAGSGLFVGGGGLDGYNENIEVTGITFKGNPSCAVDSSQSAVLLGNVRNGHLHHCEFLDTHGFAAYLGIFGTSGYYAQDSSITDNVSSGLFVQQFGVLNGKNIIIARNIITNVQPSAVVPFAAIIDCEPNGTADRMENIQILDNLIDASAALSGTDGIVVQAANSASGVRNVRIAGNIVLGGDRQVSNVMSQSIIVQGAQDVTIENNFLKNSNNPAIGCEDCDRVYIRNNNVQNAGGGGIKAMSLTATSNAIVGDNIFTMPQLVGWTADLSESELTGDATSSGSTIISTGSRFYTWYVHTGASNRTITFNATDYTITAVPSIHSVTVSPSAGTVNNGVFSSATDVNTGTDFITVTAHGFNNGCYLQYVTSGTIVGGLSNGGYYYVVNKTANTFQLSATLGGSAVDLTSTGTGTQTVYPQTKTKFTANEYRSNKYGTKSLIGTSVEYSRFEDTRVKGTVTIDPASINANTVSSQTFTLTGAATGDSLILNPPTAGLTAGLIVLQSFVSATNTITVVFQNTTGAPIDQASGTWNYTLLR